MHSLYKAFFTPNDVFKKDLYVLVLESVVYSLQCWKVFSLYEYITICFFILLLMNIGLFPVFFFYYE